MKRKEENFKNVVNQEIWDENYEAFKFFVADDEVTDYIDKHIGNFKEKNTDMRTIFEMGCFPGRYLAHICRHNHLEANGVDRTKGLNEHFINWLKENDVQVGNLINGDAFVEVNRLYKEGVTFDCVYSIGFVEHFKDYKEVILQHGKVLRKGGLLIITAPNFRGKIQRMMHEAVDKKNLQLHVLESMQPDIWMKTLEKNGYTVLEYGCFGGYDFWVGNQKRNVIQKGLLIIFMMIRKFVRLFNVKNSYLYSPYIGIVAVKNE